MKKEELKKKLEELEKQEMEIHKEWKKITKLLEEMGIEEKSKITVEFDANTNKYVLVR